MSDPAAIIVAFVVAATGAVQGANLPEPVKDRAADIAQVARDSEPELAQRIDGAIAGLPESVHEQARQGVDDAAHAAEEAVAPYVPAPLQQTSPPAGEHGSAATGPTDTGWQPPGESALSPPAWSSDPFGESADAGGERDDTAAIPYALSGVTVHPVGSFAIFAPWFAKAGELCDGVTAPTLAALYNAENGFRYGPSAPVSPSGARGPGQFMPATWQKYGKDADGDGVADILGVADSVMASGHLMCDMFDQIDTWKSNRLVSGDTLDLTIAGYNAGLGAVLQSGGMPSGHPDYENQTKPYVAKIRASQDQFAKMFSPFGSLSLSGIGGSIVQRASEFLGLPYVWGGGGVNGPSGGGFDCSGLTSYAVYAATDGRLTLPRTSETQWSIGNEVPLEQAQPGDLLFGNWGPDGPGHVAIYIGNGQMIHAPTTGDVVRIGPVFDGMKARHVLP
ncbi:MAG: lytic transglycosylase [Rhodococcus sp. (in: high G+C Gram-positive bacteria)]|nr:MAG: lytic transglycosylase [Rhodococcus sp. (in: high G+C Gram-positive bacteria)]